LRGNLGAAVSGLVQGECLRHQLGVITELLQTGHRAHQVGAGAMPADPLDFDGDSLAVVDDLDDHPLDELAEDGLALRGGGGARLPERGDVGGQLAKACPLGL
jgi:hypothetical protein